MAERIADLVRGRLLTLHVVDWITSISIVVVWTGLSRYL
jgi:hypothetical protein